MAAEIAPTMRAAPDSWPRFNEAAANGRGNPSVAESGGIDREVLQ